MKFIIKLFPEITIKSQSVRLRFIKILTSNILKHCDESVAVVRHWDHIEVRAGDEQHRPLVADALTRIPGIRHILAVEKRPWQDMHDIYLQTLVMYRDRLLLITERLEGLGGFSIGTQEDVLSLISGGFDFGVSSYMLMRRCCRVNYCFFNLGGAANEIGVRQVAHHLWRRFGQSHKVRFVSLDFAPVVNKILAKVDDGQMGWC